MNQRPLQELRLRDFRCFREEQTARLAPLTLLVGENSTGKTSLLAAVPAVLEVAVNNADPDFRSPYDLGSFNEIAHHQNPSGRRAGAESFSIGFQFAGSADSVSCEATFTLGEGAAPTVSTVRWTAGDVWLREIRGPHTNHTELGSPSGSWRLPFPSGEPEPHFIYGGFFASYARVLQAAAESGVAGDLQPLKGDGDSVPSKSECQELIRLLLESVDFDAGAFTGAPVRSSPLRTYDPVRLVRDPQGGSTPAFLANMHARDPEEWQKTKSGLEEFGRTSGLFDEIFIKRLGRHEFEPFQMEVRKWGRRPKRRKGAKRNLIDVGYGVSQVLPLLVELLDPNGSSLLLLQQPEVHLHPCAQAALGSLFCERAASGRQLVVETHSDYILDRILLDIRDKHTDLNPEDVSILYFERTDLDVSIHSIHIDSEGNVLDAPKGYRGFFEDELKRVIDY